MIKTIIIIAKQKKKREQKAKETEKIHHLDLELKAKKLEIAEKRNVWRAKKRGLKLRHLETKVL